MGDDGDDCGNDGDGDNSKSFHILLAGDGGNGGDGDIITFHMFISGWVMVVMVVTVITLHLFTCLLAGDGGNNGDCDNITSLYMFVSG